MTGYKFNIPRRYFHTMSQARFKINSPVFHVYDRQTQTWTHKKDGKREEDRQTNRERITFQYVLSSGVHTISWYGHLYLYYVYSAHVLVKDY